MKLIITSIDALIDSATGDYFPGIKESLLKFEQMGENYTVVVISIHPANLERIPDDFQKIPIINYRLRKSPKLIDMIVQTNDLDYNDIFILGAKTDDMILAANAKVILLTADYAKTNNSTDTIYTEGYGVGILSPERLTHFFNNFIGIESPWFYSMEINETTKLYGLTDAMTRRQPDASVAEICEKLKDYLKNSNRTYKNPFLIYALMSVYKIFKDVEGINYWGYYPSSGTVENEILKDIKEVLRKSFNSSKTKEDLLLRTKVSPQRKRMTTEERLKDGCDSQFKSIIINPWFKGKLKGKNVCIIDDFTNLGSSCETTRHLLEKAGVASIIFITLGKFRNDYKIFNYEIDGNLYIEDGYTYKKINGYQSKVGTINNHSSRELLDSLQKLVS